MMDRVEALDRGATFVERMARVAGVAMCDAPHLTVAAVLVAQYLTGDQVAVVEEDVDGLPPYGVVTPIGGAVRIETYSGDEPGSVLFTPSRARQFAAEVLNAADEADADDGPPPLDDAEE